MDEADDMPAEIDFTHATRNPYADRPDGLTPAQRRALDLIEKNQPIPEEILVIMRTARETLAALEHKNLITRTLSGFYLAITLPPNRVFTRCRKGIAPRILPPIAADNWLITEHHDCPLCSLPFEVGQRVTILPRQPTSEAECVKRDAGRWYAAEGYPVHMTCAEALDAREQEKAAQTVLQDGSE